MSNGKRKYKVKTVPVVIALVVLILILGILVAVAASLFKKTNDITEPTNSGVSTNVEDVPSSEVVDADQPSETEVTDETLANPEQVEQVGTGEAVEVPTLETTATNTLPDGFLRDWNLILVNGEEENGLESELLFSISKFDMQIIDTRINDAYKAMYEHAKSDGLTLYVKTAYRSIEQQLALYTMSVQEYMEKGYSRDDAIVKTTQTIPKPGHSEHHTGLALDIISPLYHMEVYYLDERFTQTAEFAWLMQNAVNYGFVLRYPADKTAITQMPYEPWHFRYVGVEHAAYMTTYNLCLEEYIEVLANAGR